MPGFFEGCSDFVINDGKFVDVNGGNYIHNDNSRRTTIHGQGNTYNTSYSDSFNHKPVTNNSYCEENASSITASADLLRHL